MSIDKERTCQIHTEMPQLYVGFFLLWGNNAHHQHNTVLCSYKRHAILFLKINLDQSIDKKCLFLTQKFSQLNHDFLFSKWLVSLLNQSFSDNPQMNYLGTKICNFLFFLSSFIQFNEMVPASHYQRHQKLLFQITHLFLTSGVFSFVLSLSNWTGMTVCWCCMGWPK